MGKRRGAPVCGSVKLSQNYKIASGLPRYAYRYDPRNDVVHSKPLEGAELLNYHKIARLLRYARNDGCYARKDATNYVTGKGRRCV
jgi:hypothetical protein